MFVFITLYYCITTYIRAGSRKNQPLKFYWSTFSNCTSTTCYNIYMNMKFRGCGFSTQDVYMHTWVVESPLFLTRGNADKSVRDWFPSVDVMVRLMFSRSTLSTKGSLNSVMRFWRKRREGGKEGGKEGKWVQCCSETRFSFKGESSNHSHLHTLLQYQ